MASQMDSVDRYLLERYKLDAECHDRHVIHTFYVSDPSQGRSKTRVQETWNQGKWLGRGAFSDVWLQQHESKTRAVKALRKSLLSNAKIDYQRELGALTRFQDKASFLKEDTITEFFGWFESDDEIFLAMQYFEFGDLSQHIPSGEILEHDAKDIALDLLEALRTIHSEGFTHRDLTPRNIFVVTKSPKWWVKIGDFGMSKRVDPEVTALRTLTGTFAFMAPEIIPDDYDEESPTYTNKVDMWSLGCVVYNILAKQPPFNGSSKARRTPFPRGPLEGRVGHSGMAFIQSLLTLDAKQRPTAEVALMDKWFKVLSFGANVPCPTTNSPEAHHVEEANVVGLHCVSISEIGKQSVQLLESQLLPQDQYEAIKISPFPPPDQYELMKILSTFPPPDQHEAIKITLASSNVKPSNEGVICVYPGDIAQPQGVKGEHEMWKHFDRAYNETRQVYMCADLEDKRGDKRGWHRASYDSSPKLYSHLQMDVNGVQVTRPRRISPLSNVIIPSITHESPVETNRECSELISQHRNNRTEGFEIFRTTLVPPFAEVLGGSIITQDLCSDD